MQEAGRAIYLVAWREDELAGRCTVLTTSKDDEVRQLLGAFPEMNALEAGHPDRAPGRRSSRALSTRPGSAEPQ